jgi:serine O-acetyltransferase
MKRQNHPLNKFIKNRRLANIYLKLLRRRIPIVSKVLEIILNNEIACKIPESLFLPHPYGIVAGKHVGLAEYVVLMQQVTLGGKDPFFQGDEITDEFPIVGEGAYIGSGAKILGHVEIGEYAIVGANAVVTKAVPDWGIVVGNNRFIGLSKKEKYENTI